MINVIAKTLIINASRIFDRDIKSTLSFVSENLTPAEFKKVEGFLIWCSEHNRTFGFANFEEVFREYESSRKK